ncbi:MAG: DNA repair protein RecO [Actinobacteria bacterium]|nr:MAG: DNA repair protein RecO [Actinomycetota bacterium]
MATYKEEAVVLRAYDLGEADRILTMITAGRGLRRAVAKGVKRTRSKFGGRLEPFTHLDAVLHEGRNLDTVVQVEIIRSHESVRADFAKFLFGEAMLEMIEKSLHEGQRIPRIFEALCVTLDVLEGDVCDPALLLAAFEFKICALIGYHPHLDCCLHCGRKIEGGRACLDLSGGGIACADCSRGLENLQAMSPDSLSLIRCLLSEDMATVACREESPRVCRDVLGTAFRFSESFLDRPLRSRQVVLRYLDKGT